MKRRATPPYIEAVKTKFRTSDENAMGIQEWLAWAKKPCCKSRPADTDLPTLLSEEEAPPTQVDVPEAMRH